MAPSFRDDPDWQLAHAEYLYPDADDPDAKTLIRVRAAVQMREIETGATLTAGPEELMDRVSALTDSEHLYALNWLATAGGATADGQALLRALDAVSRYRERLAAVTR